MDSIQNYLSNLNSDYISQNGSRFPHRHYQQAIGFGLDGGPLQQYAKSDSEFTQTQTSQSIIPDYVQKKRCIDDIVNNMTGSDSNLNSCNYFSIQNQQEQYQCKSLKSKTKAKSNLSKRLHTSFSALTTDISAIDSALNFNYQLDAGLDSNANSNSNSKCDVQCQADRQRINYLLPYPTKERLREQQLQKQREISYAIDAGKQPLMDVMRVLESGNFDMPGSKKKQSIGEWMSEFDAKNENENRFKEIMKRKEIVANSLLSKSQLDGKSNQEREAQRLEQINYNKTLRTGN